MDAIGSARVSEFMGTYVNSNDLERPDDPQHRAAMEQALADFRLLANDLAQVESMLAEISGHRAFIQWMTTRIQEAEERGEDTYLLKWDRGDSAARVRNLESRVAALLGPSLESRLVDSRESFRLRYLDSGALGAATGWAGEDPTIQAALDGMLITDTAQAVVNQYLYSIGNLQRDCATLERSLAPGGSLAPSPQRKRYEQVLSHWRQQAASHVQTVMGLLDGTVDVALVDPVPWSARPEMDAAAKPPLSAAERRAFQLAEDGAWLSALGQEARTIEGALAQLAPKVGKGPAGSGSPEEIRERNQRRYDLVQRQRALVETIKAVRDRLETLRSTTRTGDGTLQAVDLEVASARHLLEGFSLTMPADSRLAEFPPAADADAYEATLSFLGAEQASLVRSQAALAGTIERLGSALEVPRGFKLSDQQRGELGVLWSQRAELLRQQALINQEADALKAMVDATTRDQRRGLPFDHGAHLERQNAWESARQARQEGEAARQGALTTPVPTLVAWRLSPRNGNSRKPTVVANYLLDPQSNANVNAQLAADRQASASLRGAIQALDTAIQQALARLAHLTRSGATTVDKADAPWVQARLSALQSLRTAEVNRLLRNEQVVKGNEALLLSTSADQVSQRQQAVESAQSMLPGAWLDQLRKEHQLAKADLDVAQRGLDRLKGAPGTSNSELLEAQRLLAYREKAKTYAQARVVAIEAELRMGAQTTSVEAAQLALGSAREDMQATYYDLAILRQILRRDELSRQLGRATANGTPIDEILRLQQAVAAAQAAWPLHLAPPPATNADKAAAVQARHGDGLPE